MPTKPDLKVLLQNKPKNIFSRMAVLERAVRELQSSDGSPFSAPDGSMPDGVQVVDLLLYPAEGVTVTDPTSTDYTGGFLSGDGIDYSGTVYVSGNVINGVIKTGFTSIGTLYAIDAVISGTITIGTGSSAGGWLINSTQIFSGSITLDSAVPAIKIGSATAIMTGTGVFIGNDSGTYKMRIGDPAANYLLWNGVTLAASGQWIKSAGMNPALQEWKTNIVFSSASDTQVNWTSGTIVLSDGTTYSIVSGNTGTMSALNYIYLDIAVSLTVLQKTTTYSTATGDGKILVAAAQNATAGASVLPFGGQQPIINGGVQITALSILAGNIAAGAITASKISVSTLSAIVADLGTITAGTITLSGVGSYLRAGATPPTSAAGGAGTAGTWFDYTGLYSLSGTTVNATITSTGLTGGAGAVVVDVNGITRNRAGIFDEFRKLSGGVGNIASAFMMGVNGVSYLNFYSDSQASITNADFENGATGWTTVAGSPTVSTTQAHSPTHSMQLNSAGEAIRTSSFYAIASTSGMVEFWWYPTVADDTLIVYIESYNAASTFVNNEGAGSVTNGADINKWMKFQLVGDYYDATVTKIKLYFECALGNTSYIDDVAYYDGSGYQVFLDSNGMNFAAGGINVNKLMVNDGEAVDFLSPNATSFTPTIEGTTAAGVGTYTAQAGSYIVMNKMVFVDITLIWTAHTGTGNMIVAGLPYAARNANNRNMPLTVQWSGITLPAVGDKVQATVTNNTSQVSLQSIGSGNAAALAIDAAATLRLSGWYFRQ